MASGGVFQLENVGVRLSEITDGTHCTIMVGEKHVQKGNFGYGWSDNSAYNGDYPHSYLRGVQNEPVDFNGLVGVVMATDINEDRWKWGSYHTAVVQFVFCDGHVKGIWRGLDAHVLELLCVRNDGEVIPDYWSPP
jgi:prepilin-type processing-associated H-X9-DG protein